MVTGNTNTTIVLVLNTTHSTTSPVPSIIHPYWRQFGDISMEWHCAVAVWVALVSVVGIAGNTCVAAVYLRSPDLRTPTNMLLVNLALSNFCFSLNGFPVLVLNSMQQTITWGGSGCTAYGFLAGWFGLVSINTHAVIALDRHRVITHPLTSITNKLSYRRACLYLACAWLLPMLWCALPFLGFGNYIPEGFQTSCTFDYLTHNTRTYIHIAGLYVGGFVMPLIVIIYCYAGIAWYAHNAGKHLRKLQEDQATSARLDSKRHYAVTRMTFALVSCFVLAWLPYAAVGLVGLFSPPQSKLIAPFVSEIPLLIAKSSAAINPIVYSLTNPNFRRRLRRRNANQSSTNQYVAMTEQQNARSIVDRRSMTRQQTLLDEYPPQNHQLCTNNDEQTIKDAEHTSLTQFKH